MDYARLDFFEVERLPIDIYFGLQRDAYIFNLQQTESGRDYLEQCWILSQTEPDRGALREKFGKGQSMGNIKGITIEIGSDTKKQKRLSGAE